VGGREPPVSKDEREISPMPKKGGGEIEETTRGPGNRDSVANARACAPRYESVRRIGVEGRSPSSNSGFRGSAWRDTRLLFTSTSALHGRSDCHWLPIAAALIAIIVRRIAITSPWSRIVRARTLHDVGVVASVSVTLTPRGAQVFPGASEDGSISAATAPILFCHAP